MNEKAIVGDADWNGFWANVKNMEFNSDQLHAILNVKSMKEWAAAGKSLDDAIRAISDHLVEGKVKS